MNRVKKGLIVSLTTYGKRLHSVSKTIESIQQQSCLPEFVVLWLNELEHSESSLPESITQFDSDFLKVRFCKDRRSYTKLTPSLTAYPDKIIITIDDDYKYPPDLIEQLVKAHETQPANIVCARARLIKYTNNDFESYHDWTLLNYNSKISADDCLLPLGYAGVLYPPGSLHPDTTNASLFMQLAPHADDLWFKCMGLLKGTPVTVLPSAAVEGMATIAGTQDDALHVTHNAGEKNTEQMRTVVEHYSQLQEGFSQPDYYDVTFSGLELAKNNRLITLGSIAKDSFPVFRDSSIALEESHPLLSKRLFNLARKIRPFAPFFKNSNNS